MIEESLLSLVYEKIKEIGFYSFLGNLEAELLEKALKEKNYSTTQVAKMLRVNRTTLVEKFKRLGISVPREKSRKEEAMRLLKNGMRNCDVMRKLNLSESYVSKLARYVREF